MNTIARRMILSAMALAAAVTGRAPAQPDISIPAPGLVSPALAIGDNSSDTSVSIASDGTGRLLACWATNRGLSADSGRSSRTVFSASADDGATWSPPVTPPTFNFAGDQAATRVEVFSNRAGRWIAAWTAGSATEVFVASSDDHGHSWSAARTLAVTGGANSLPRLCGDGAGRWVAVWRSRGLEGGATARNIAVATSGDNGQTWTAPRVLNDRHASSGSSPGVDVATDGQGRCVVTLAFENDDEEGIRALGSGDMGLSFGVPITIAAFANAPEHVFYNAAVDTDGQDRWMIAWSASHPPAEGDAGLYNIYASRSTDDGASWTPAARVNTNSLNQANEWDFQPDIAFDSDGRGLIAWETWSYVQPTTFVVWTARSADGGASWANSVRTSAATSNGTFDTAPRVVAGSAGRLVIAWNSQNRLGGALTVDPDIVMRSTVDGGATFTGAVRALDPTAGADGSGNDRGPRLAIDHRSRAVLIWRTDTGLGPNSALDEDLAVSTSTDAGRTWSMPRALSAAAATDSIPDTWATVMGDSSGTWMVAWAGQQPTRVRAGALVSRSTDDGGTWSTPVVLNPDPAGQWTYESCNVAHVSGGRWLVAWCSDDWLDGTIDFDFDIFYSVTDDGGQTWSAAELLNSDAELDSLDDRGMSVVAGGGDTVVAAFHRGPGRAIAFSVSRDAGSTWTPVRFAFPDGGSRGPVSLATDGAGRWMMCWREAAPATDTLLTVRSVDDGETWSGPLIVPMGTGGTQRILDPAIACDRSGTWIIATGRDGQIATLRSINGGVTWSPVRTHGTTPNGGPTIAASTVGASSAWAMSWASTNPTGPRGVDLDLYFTAFTIDDCDGNGRADALDIGRFGAADCNGNMIPDLCDLGSGRSADCDDDGLLDSCELAAGAADVNRDGVPDECQCLPDRDGNGSATVEDLFVFLGGWFGRTDAGDFNNDNAWNLTDLFGFLGAYFAGCD